VHPRLIVCLRSSLLEGGFKIEALDAESLACVCALDLRGRGIVHCLIASFDRMRLTASLARSSPPSTFNSRSIRDVTMKLDFGHFP
jgi:hypothetical protein